MDPIHFPSLVEPPPGFTMISNEHISNILLDDGKTRTAVFRGRVKTPVATRYFSTECMADDLTTKRFWEDFWAQMLIDYRMEPPKGSKH